ncbi:MAG TPA: hypothetical protein VNO21_20770, partial [Polyangiaceae bacterium]|nr:hypothetical protein [Polyangiaceae bacterium]
RWPHGPLAVERVLLASNRVRIRIVCPRWSDRACEIAFDEQSGLLVASVAEPGFLDEMPMNEARVLFENALAGFYQLAGVDLVREEIEAAVGPARYDISDEGLVLWPDGSYRTEWVYPLRATKLGTLIQPRVRGLPPVRAPMVLDERRILFRHRAIAWSAWVDAWEAAARVGGPLPRLLSDTELLPPSPYGGGLGWGGDRVAGRRAP